MLDGVLGALVADHPPGTLGSDRVAAGGLLEHVEVLPAHQLGPHPVEDRPAAPQEPARQPGAPAARRSRPGTGRRAGGRPRAPNASASPCHPAPAVQRGEPPVRGRHARAGCRDPSITSSWTSAAAWKSSSASRRRDDRRGGPRRRRRASPSSRTPAAAVCRRPAGQRRRRPAERRSALLGAQDLALAVEEAAENALRTRGRRLASSGIGRLRLATLPNPTRGRLRQLRRVARGARRP